jgi:hypothetical protein
MECMDTAAPDDHPPVGSVDGLASGLQSLSMGLSLPHPVSDVDVSGEEDERPMADQYTEECGRCMLDFALSETKRLHCCGQVMCLPCLHSTTLISDHCASCRELRVVPTLAAHAAAGKVWAHYEIGYSYILQRNFHKAAEHMMIAEKENYLLSKMPLASFYQFGYGGVQKSEEKSIEYRKLLSDAGIEAASYMLGNTFARRGDLKQSLHYMEVAVHQRSHTAQYSLGEWYIRGQCGLDVDTAKGVALVKLAADAGLTIAEQALGFYYYAGNMVEKSMKLALHYLTLAVGPRSEKRLIQANGENPLYPHPLYCTFFLIAKCYATAGPEESAIDSYYWFKKFLKHPARCMDPYDDLRDFETEDIEATRMLRKLSEELKSCCTNCSKEAGNQSLARCSGCKSAYYCSTECQKQGWGHHKEICKKLGVL